MSAEGVTCYVQGFPVENTKQIGELEPTCYGQGYPAENTNHICESSVKKVGVSARSSCSGAARMRRNTYFFYRWLGPTGYRLGFPAKNSKHILYCLCTLMQCL